MQDFTLIIGSDPESGQLSAIIPELPGCCPTGETLKELKENAHAAISRFLTEDPSSMATKHFLGVQSIQMEM